MSQPAMHVANNYESGSLKEFSGETQVRIHEYGEGGVNLPQPTAEP